MSAIVSLVPACCHGVHAVLTVLTGGSGPSKQHGSETSCATPSMSACGANLDRFGA